MRVTGLPSDFLDSMKALLGDDFETFLKSFDQEFRQGLRVNCSKINPGEFRQRVPFLLKKIPWIENGFYYDKKDAVTKHPWYYAGLYYIQEPSAMIPASRLPVKPGDFVLDLCAAPGGKATELGARLSGRGMLLANDVSHSRAQALLKNLELCGIPNLFVSSEDSTKLRTAYTGYFDKILVDAPCSGEGMFRRDPSMVKDWQKRGPDYYVPIQRRLLFDAAAMLKPGGMLLYSTCTFSVRENEENVLFLLEKCPDMKLIKPRWNERFSCGVKAGLEDCIRILPHDGDGEGHFAALLGKEKNAALCPEAVDKKELYRQAMGEGTDLIKEIRLKFPADGRAFEEFAKLLRLPLKGSLYTQRERVYLLPPGVRPRQSIRYLRTGLYLGDLEKGRFAPSQALALCLNERTFQKSISFAWNDPRILRYLKGETLDLSGTAWEAFQGWVLVCVDGYGVGWGKAVNGMLRNKYYAGWRMQA